MGHCYFLCYLNDSILHFRCGRMREFSRLLEKQGFYSKSHTFVKEMIFCEEIIDWSGGCFCHFCDHSLSIKAPTAVFNYIWIFPFNPLLGCTMTLESVTLQIVTRVLVLNDTDSLLTLIY